MEQQAKKIGLELLREPFPAYQISKLPKGTKEQNNCQASEKRKCEICGGFHHPKIIHLDYVGHAALTDRLLDADPLWSWEPFAVKDGLPAFDESGGLWIKLTVCGQTRIGYGHAEKSNFKEIGSREKEVIGDALRNAAMRFGAALDLWHKGDLHGLDNDDPPETKPEPPAPKEPKKETHKEPEYVTVPQKKSIEAIITMNNLDRDKVKEYLVTRKVIGPKEDGKPTLNKLYQDYARKILDNPDGWLKAVAGCKEINPQQQEESNG